MSAREDLDRALVAVAAAGLRLPCTPDSHAWLSDLAAERRLAAEECADCPVLDECLSSAIEEDERRSVRGGVDFRDDKARKRLRRAA